MLNIRIHTIFLSFLLFIISGCSSDDLDAALDLVDGVPRKDIERSRLAINAFANDAQFGTPSEQFAEVRRLGINRVRLLFAWNSQVQPTPQSSPDFSFYDFILSGLPSDFRAIVVLTDVPDWVANESNWINGDPTNNFVDQWVTRVIRRYGSDPRIEGFQIWNEPNDVNLRENNILNLSSRPARYAQMLAGASNVVRSNSSKKVLNAATTAINQNFPDSLNYNISLVEAGALDSVDYWAIHYYGEQFENVLRGGGVKSFLNSFSKPIWITETGERGVNNQLEYGETAWPFLVDNIDRLDRIYIYQFAENSPSSSTYGLRNPDAAAPVSDLYLWLRQG